MINVETVDANDTNASGEFSVFRKITGPDETIDEIKGLRRDLTDHMDQRFSTSRASWPRSNLRCELRA